MYQLVHSTSVVIILSVELLVPDSTKLISFFRDKRAQYIYRATSSDDGITWSKPRKTTLPNNDSGIQATVLNSGRIAMVYNPTNSERLVIYRKSTTLQEGAVNMKRFGCNLCFSFGRDSLRGQETMY